MHSVRIRLCIREILVQLILKQGVSHDAQSEQAEKQIDHRCASPWLSVLVMEHLNGIAHLVHPVQGINPACNQ